MSQSSRVISYSIKSNAIENKWNAVFVFYIKIYHWFAHIFDRKKNTKGIDKRSDYLWDLYQRTLPGKI